MKLPRTPGNEADRLAALGHYEVLDSEPEAAFDALTTLAAHVAGVPIALISIVDADRQWFKSRYGLDVPQTPRDVSFCGHVVVADAPLVVHDALVDDRFADNPLVTGDPHVRFYAGIPLRTPEGFVLGTLCAIDHEPREIAAPQLVLLDLLAKQVVALLELRRRNLVLARARRELDTYRAFFDLAHDLFATIDGSLRIEECNPAWRDQLGWASSELRGASIMDFVHPDDRDATVREASRLRHENTPTIGFEHRFRHKDGRWVLLSWVVTVNGGVFFASARDITTLREQQAALATALEVTADERSRLHSILASANHAIIETTPEGRFREFNLAAERMLGYSAAEVIGRRPPVHVPDEIVARAAELSAELGIEVKPNFEALIAKARLGIPDEREWTYVRKDGTRFPVELSISARRNEAGEVAGYIGIASDISRRRHVEAAVEEQTRLLKLGADVGSAFTKAADLATALGACAEAIVTHLDAAFARVWTLDGTNTVLELQASAGLYTHLDGPHGRIPVGKLKIGLIAQERRPLRSNELAGDPRIGDSAWAVRERMVAFAGYPLVVSDRLVGVVAMFARRAISDAEFTALGGVARSLAVGIDRLQALVQLDEFKSTLDRTEDSIFIYDPATLRISYANEGARRQLGYTTAELLTMTPLDFKAEFDEARYRRMIEASMRGDASGIWFETLHRHKDGHDIPVEVVLQHVARAGQPARCINVVRDLRERKRIERLQSEFISTVSHELRTPLTSIRGSLGLVAAGVTGALPAEAKEYVDIALANSDRLVRLINDILDIERMQSGQMEFRMRTCDLQTLVAQTVAANEPGAVAQHVRLTWTTEVPSCEVVVDPDRFAQVLTNLISNAAKFSPRGAAVELAAELVDERIRIAIRDHGPGVPASFGPRIFQRFAQADTSSTRAKGGTGLGLHISKSIIERMRGRIGYEPADGGGARFFVEVPCLPAITGATTTSKPRVLVCEDDPDVYRTIRRSLEAVGFVVDVAPTLDRARRLLATARYVAATLDLALADGDGATLLREVRATPATSELPVILVTGSAEAAHHNAVLVSDVIVKPFDEARLAAAVRHAATGCGGTRPRVLHVEDDADLRRIVKKTLPADWTVIGAGTLQEARQILLSESSFDVVLFDLALPDGRGDELIGLVGKAHVIIFSAADPSSDLARRVSAALVKTKSSSHDLRSLIVSIVERGRADRAHA